MKYPVRPLLRPSLVALLFLVVMGTAAPGARAQAPANPPSNAENNGGSSEEKGFKGFWEITTPGGRFVTRLNAITSVSEHTYIIDGAVRVFEVTVDTTGPMCARFYYLEPVTDDSPLSITKNVMERTRTVAEKVTERTGTDEVWTDVVKHYPDTTHAKTAEYRLENQATIDQIYNHIHKVWVRGDNELNRLVIRNG